MNLLNELRKRDKKTRFAEHLLHFFFARSCLFDLKRQYFVIFYATLMDVIA